MDLLVLVFDKDKKNVLIKTDEDTRLLNYLSDVVFSSELPFNSVKRCIKKELNVDEKDCVIHFVRRENVITPLWANEVYIAACVLDISIEPKGSYEWVPITDRDYILDCSVGRGSRYLYLKEALYVINK